ncbi:MAG: hypothetical protein AB7T32_19785 [Dehalococcoidia bacterium]
MLATGPFDSADPQGARRCNIALHTPRDLVLAATQIARAVRKHRDRTRCSSC